MLGLPGKPDPLTDPKDEFDIPEGFFFCSFWAGFAAKLPAMLGGLVGAAWVLC